MDNEKIYVGSGKSKFEGSLINTTINLSKISKTSKDYIFEYGGDKFVTYPSMQEPISKQDGPPPQRTVVSLSFSEIEILTRESVDAQRY